MRGHHHRAHRPHRSLPTAVTSARDELRASDAEREEAVALLREHAGSGRLEVAELSDRVDAVYAARTRAEVGGSLRDLPAIAPPGRREAVRARDRHEFFGHLRSYVLVNLLLVALWAATGADYFWPLWPLLGWGVGIASHGRQALGASAGRGGHHRLASPGT